MSRFLWLSRDFKIYPEQIEEEYVVYNKKDKLVGVLDSRGDLDREKSTDGFLKIFKYILSQGVRSYTVSEGKLTSVSLTFSEEGYLNALLFNLCALGFTIVRRVKNG